MTQTERRIFLIRSLLNEQPQYRDMEIPQSEQEQKRLLRALFNIRMPKEISKVFLQIQDEYLKNELQKKGITDYKTLTPTEDGVYLWQGDITSLRCDAVVNAANSRLLGCFYPCHGCIDNAVHTYAGVQLRLACAELMREQGYDEATGKAKITSGYNLPSKYVIHTVGPIICGAVEDKDIEALSDCYRSCLKIAERNNVKSIAFCCISTGEFHFPNRQAAETAIQTVNAYKTATGSNIEVIYNVFKDTDFKIYRELLG